MKNYIQNELVCLRAVEPVGSDRYNELSKAIQWLEENTKKEEASSTGVKNNYAVTRIRWKDSGDELDVIFKLNANRGKFGFELDEKDEQIFFYCESEDEYKKLLNYDNGEDFEIIGCTLYTDTI